MKKYYFALWIIIAMNAVHAQTQLIYKWTDANGNVHFSDKSYPGAEKIELPQAQTYSSPKIPAPISRSDAATDIETNNNFKIRIAQPEEQATIRNAQRQLSVILDVKPKLENGFKVQLIVDGSPSSEPQASTFFALEDINRGSHTLVAQLIDNKGKVLSTSEQITIYMMPPRVGMGNHSH